jgi:hypothetical protein
MKEIIYVNYGISSSYDDVIEMNEKLNKYPILKQKILEHELRHENGRYTKKDFKNDFQAKNSSFFDSLKFAFKNPEAIINYFPFMYSYHKKVMTYNSSALYPFIYFGLLFSLFFTLLFKINFFLCLFSWAILFMGTNVLLLVLTHLLVKKIDKTKVN